MVDTRESRLVVIPAHGLGSRIRDVTGGRPKTLLELGGVPILERLLTSILGHAEKRVVIYEPTADDSISRYIAGQTYRDRVEVRRRDPEGYLVDVVWIAGDLGEAFSVIDSDTVVVQRELSDFVGANREAWTGVPFVVGALELGSRDNPRLICFKTRGDRGEVVADVKEGDICAMGVYHWHLSGLERARDFLNTRGGSWHAFMEDLARDGTPVGYYLFSRALNVNTREELHTARQTLRAWREEGLE